jgi:hypothetical protein
VSSGFTGSILVARGDNVILEKTYGSPPRRQAVASITKQFTAAAILLLEERGRLRIDDPVSTHLPNTPAAWKDMTTSFAGSSHSGAAGSSPRRALAKMTMLNKGDYGLGVHVQTLEGRRLIRHGGGAPAFAHLSWYPESRVSVVVLGNMPTAPAPEISAFLGTLAHGGRVVLASERKGISLPPAVLARCVGHQLLRAPVAIAAATALGPPTSAIYSLR